MSENRKYHYSSISGADGIEPQRYVRHKDGISPGDKIRLSGKVSSLRRINGGGGSQVW
ncbi:hypothetical protein BLNAU_23169 [Blattamonas nauphoetae]|uniref:Uncharacterized protein n=1 Tax=Blattamonas nauphoetae TaxID=2049346 RepID=A0ABQ9WV44_9EUKA|nr:hypothetical protein BLNAU_23169 [Blattamonas nauphoetae]